VSVGRDVTQLLADLRQYLQEKCEPPVYVSDRRLVKAVGLMQVAAYTSGRDAVSMYDCLLLQHVLWQRPEEHGTIVEFLLSQMAEDDGFESADYIFKGIFSRACLKALGSGTEKQRVRDELLQEATNLRDSLIDKLGGIREAVAGSNVVGGTKGGLWVGGTENEVVSTRLLPKLQATEEQHSKLLFEVSTMQAWLSTTASPVDAATLLPSAWAHFLKEKQDVDTGTTRKRK
jgi:MoxR-like ATPase